MMVRVQREHDVVAARQRARQIAAALGFDATEQTRIATAVSELARNAFEYAAGGTIEYTVEGSVQPQLFTVRIADNGRGFANLEEVLSGRYTSKTGMGIGILGSRRLMDQFEVVSTPGGSTITIKKILPKRAPLLKAPQIGRLAETLLAERPANPLDEVQRQNQELLSTLGELRARQEELERVNRELEDTNRGVVALYA
jgi:anti-sigma regulatory factor (Ser/Thr protein kinase)